MEASKKLARDGDTRVHMRRSGQDKNLGPFPHAGGIECWKAWSGDKAQQPRQVQKLQGAVQRERKISSSQNLRAKAATIPRMQRRQALEQAGKSTPSSFINTTRSYGSVPEGKGKKSAPDKTR